MKRLCLLALSLRSSLYESITVLILVFFLASRGVRSRKAGESGKQAPTTTTTNTVSANAYVVLTLQVNHGATHLDQMRIWWSFLLLSSEPQEFTATKGSSLSSLTVCKGASSLGLYCPGGRYHMLHIDNELALSLLSRHLLRILGFDPDSILSAGERDAAGFLVEG